LLFSKFARRLVQLVSVVYVDIDFVNQLSESVD